MISRLILIFVAGFIVDLLITKHMRYIAEKMTARATVLSGLITVVNFLMLTIIVKDSMESGVVSVLAFAGGNSLGTFMAMKKV